MATTPGFLSDWPWKPLGNFKYLIMAPWAIQSLYMLATKEDSERDYMTIMLIPFCILRFLHNQLWITISRHRTANGKNRIVDKNIEFDQIDRESNWDDQLLLTGITFYILILTMPEASHLPFWRWDGVVSVILLHIGPVEFLYYWLHRALHHHYLYSRYHSHHHSSIVTEPISSVVHPFAENIAYIALFSVTLMPTVLAGTASIASAYGYVLFLDVMNNMGHCNFELIPERLFSIFPPLKYMMYTPSFHSLHHTQFRTNYSLFMPFYDYIYGTMDKTTDSLHESSLKKQADTPDVVHLTHLTTPGSIYHLRLGFPSLASKPQESKWYIMLLLWPLTLWSMIMTSLYGRTFVAERNVFDKLKLQSWVIPKYKRQYHSKRGRQTINDMIEDAILEADASGAKVLSLGLMNQDSELNNHGNLYIMKHPELNVKLVDGSSLAAALVLHSIPQGTSEVLLRGNLSNKIATLIASELCQRGLVRVATLYEYDYEKLKLSVKPNNENNLVLSKPFNHKIWVVGEGLSDEEQHKAPKGTIFIPYSQFPPKKLRSDCFYYSTPAMMASKSLQNLDSCENWLPRRVMSAWRVAGIVHALEGWNRHECGGDTALSIDEVWQASLRHGFQPLEVLHNQMMMN